MESDTLGGKYQARGNEECLMADFFKVLLRMLDPITLKEGERSLISVRSKHMKALRIWSMSRREQQPPGRSFTSQGAEMTWMCRASSSKMF